MRLDFGIPDDIPDARRERDLERRPTESSRTARSIPASQPTPLELRREIMKEQAAHKRPLDIPKSTRQRGPDCPRPERKRELSLERQQEVQPRIGRDHLPPPCTVTNLVDAANSANVDGIGSQVDLLGPTLMTSIGAGLQSANDCGFSKDGSGNTKAVLLFSDGEQNTPPMVTTSGTPPNQISLDGNAYDGSIKVCPVTAGRQAAPGFGLQQRIAIAKCSGNEAHIRDTDQTFAVADLQTFFAQFLAAILPTDKLEIVADTTGVVTRGQSSLEKYFGAPNDLKTTIVLSWFGGSEADRILPFRLTAPDGTIVDLTSLTTVANGTSSATLPFPLFQSGRQIVQNGEWQLVIDGAKLHSPSINYHLLVLSDNPTVSSDFAIDASDVGTGESIPLRVKLTDGGVPVLHATVQAQLEGPQNSQGNVLSTTPTPPASTSGPDTASTKGQAKLDALYNDPANASLFADKSLPTLTLVDQNNTGVYTGELKDTSTEGHYYFSIRVRGTSATARTVQRAYQISRFVRSKPDPGQTVFKLLSFDIQANGSALATLQAIPHDKFKNFLGPGYEKDMKIKSSQGTIESPLDDKLDGSYEITYRLPSASSNPFFTIEIMGQTVTTKTRKQLQGQTGGRFALFLDAGGNFPHGTFGQAFDHGFSLNAGLEYMLASHFSVEGIFGYHRFPGKITPDLDIYQFSGNAKAYLTTGTFQPFANGGVGGYRLSIGSGSSSTYFGGNVGVGVLWNLTFRFGLQGSYNFHVVNTPVEATKFSTAQGGIRFVF